MIEHGLLSFSDLLREKPDELDADEASQDELAFDPVERLRLDARRTILAGQSGPMARAGHQAYVAPTAGPPEKTPGQRHLDLLY